MEFCQKSGDWLCLCVELMCANTSALAQNKKSVWSSVRGKLTSTLDILADTLLHKNRRRLSGNVRHVFFPFVFMQLKCLLCSWCGFLAVWKTNSHRIVFLWLFCRFPKQKEKKDSRTSEGNCDLSRVTGLPFLQRLSCKNSDFVSLLLCLTKAVPSLVPGAGVHYTSHSCSNRTWRSTEMIKFTCLCFNRGG